jgi:hypothetical protein
MMGQTIQNLCPENYFFNYMKVIIKSCFTGSAIAYKL